MYISIVLQFTLSAEVSVFFYLRLIYSERRFTVEYILYMNILEKVLTLFKSILYMYYDNSFLSWLSYMI